MQLETQWNTPTGRDLQAGTVPRQEDSVAKGRLHMQDDVQAATERLQQLTAMHEQQESRWLEERSALMEELSAQQAHTQAAADTQMRQREQTCRQPLQAKLEGKLREQLNKKSQLVRALRDAIKQLGVHQILPLCASNTFLLCASESRLHVAASQLVMTQRSSRCAEAKLIESEQQRVDEGLQRSSTAQRTTEHTVTTRSVAQHSDSAPAAAAAELAAERKKGSEARAACRELERELQLSAAQARRLRRSCARAQTGIASPMSP